MSYILDALKKAERERELAKVTNVENVQDIAIKRKKVGLIVAEIGVICMIAVTWLYFGTSSGQVESKTPAPTVIHHDSVTEDSESMPETRESIDQSSNTPSASTGIALNPSIPNPANTPIATVAEMQSRASALKQETIVPKIKTESRIVSAKPDNSVTNIKTNSNIAATANAGTQKPPPAFNNAGLSIAKAAIPAIVARESPNLSGNSGNLPSLRGIADSMKNNISFHVYSDNPERRMVFINGKRHREGDYLEHDCILEGITPEGLILRRGEETVVLRFNNGS